METVRYSLEAAGYTVAVAQAQIDRAQVEGQRKIWEAQAEIERIGGRRQQRVQARMAVVGVGLALMQLIDQRVAAEALLLLIRSILTDALVDLF